ncbi:MAG: NAD(P)H-dependent oxidoreductase subunit E, partial [Dehalococcoidia bacterium]|nr:NAD(P)H-dependent oxidoreductase subunit E [Dehalococcoidia bacterium]
MKALKSISELNSYRDLLLRQSGQQETCVRVCTTGCRAHGALEVRDALVAEIKSLGLEERVEVRDTGCHGFCARAPLIAIDPDEIFYQEVTVEDVPDIVSMTLMKGELVERLLYHDTNNGGHTIPHAKRIPFYKSQTRNVLRNCGQIDPKNIRHYIARDGYAALANVLSGMSPEQVIETVSAAKLRGRGGAGFPTGSKWRFTRQAPSDSKYVICNADEGDPGAFMDRSIMEGDPHTVIEGMTIAAYAIGA